MVFTPSIELHKNTVYLTVGWFADMAPDMDLFHRACQATPSSDVLSRLSNDPNVIVLRFNNCNETVTNLRTVLKPRRCMEMDVLPSLTGYGQL